MSSTKETHNSINKNKYTMYKTQKLYVSCTMKKKERKQTPRPKKWKKPFKSDTMLSTWFQKVSAAICSADPLWSWLASHFQTLWHLKTQSHFGLLSSLERGYREITGATLPTCSTWHPLSPRNETNWCPTVTICLLDCDNRKPIFGHHFSLSYTEMSFSTITEEDEESQRTWYLFRDKKKERKKKRKRDWNALPPTELYLSNGPLSGDKLILKIRGHFLCVFTCSLHTVVSLKHKKLIQLYSQRANVSECWVILVVIVTTSDPNGLLTLKLWPTKLFQALSAEIHSLSVTENRKI